MAEYSKIQTLFKRDEKGIIIPYDYTYPEFQYLENCTWECTEKIDGTNIRIELDFITYEDGVKEIDVNYKGRTDRASIPSHLYNKLKELFDNVEWGNIFNMDNGHVTLYGEGYGTKIQKCGGDYIKKGVDFILFDVKVEKWWLGREDVVDIAGKLNIKAVPVIGYFTIREAVDYVRKGFKSTISEDKNLEAEGLVLKTQTGLLKRNGERLVTKLKTSDFRKYEASIGPSLKEILTPPAIITKHSHEAVDIKKVFKDA